jgi:hypothetical protein
MDIIFMTRDQNYPQAKEQQIFQGLITTCDDEAASWSRSNHLSGTMLPSSDDSDDSNNNFS